MNSGMRSTTYVAHGTNYSTSWAFTEVYTRDLSEMPEDVKTQLANYIQGGTPANPSANGRGEAFAEIFQTRYGSCDSAIDRLIKQHFDDTVAWVYALLPPPVLTATTGAARGVSASGGTLHGSADAFGVATSYRYEYGPTSAYGSSTALADAGAGVGAVEVAAQVDGLTPGTTYHYRVVVVRWGVAVLYGADTQFTTGSSPTALRPFVIVAPTIGGSPGVGGRLSCAPGSWAATARSPARMRG